MKKIDILAINQYKIANPYKTYVLSNTRLVNSESDVRHIVIKRDPNLFNFYEGQSIGIYQSSKPRLYSLASSSSDDIAICVKRVPNGEVSNYLCDLKANDPVNLIGPFGKNFLLPIDNKMDILLFATGTGIAPFRSFLYKMFLTSEKKWEGAVHLFFGARNRSEALYHNSENNDLMKFNIIKNYQSHLALSREEFNINGSKIYIQDKLLNMEETIFPILEKRNFTIYICGIKGVEKEIETVIGSWYQKRGYDSKSIITEWKNSGIFNVEVY